ncbi:hypothetical protein ABIE30_002961 [Janthinobacterium lividum]|uniref:hypothetical protein n=1 Tax=Janthinobacterium lividum TaxID=29581 RepID=UPI003D201B85
MKICKFLNMKLDRLLIAALRIFLGMLVSGSAFSATMTIIPSSPAAKINERVVMKIKFDGKVNSLTDTFLACPGYMSREKCTMISPSLRILDQNKVIVGYFSGPVTCSDGGKITVQSINYFSCKGAVVNVELPAKSVAGKYSYTAVRDTDIFSESFSVNFDVKIGGDADISPILPILLD